MKPFNDRNYWKNGSTLRFGWFQKWWYPQIINFNRVFHHKPSILGYPYFWKHPFLANRVTPGLGEKLSLQKLGSKKHMALEEMELVDAAFSTLKDFEGASKGCGCWCSRRFGSLVHPWKLIWPWKIPIFNWKYIIKWRVFHRHVSFPG